MKKCISLIVAAMLIAGVLSACSPGSQSAVPGSDPAAAGSDPAAPGRMQIVTTIFPVYDWVLNILGENPAEADVTMLLDTGVDLHSFQPTAEDILTISTCDLFIYVGGESDEWVEDALQEVTNKDMIVIDLLDVLGDAVKEEEVIEGMQEEEDDHEEGGQEDDHGGHEHEDSGAEYDEHVWLSLRNAAVLVGNISDAVQKTDPDNAGLYEQNAAAYTEQLRALDAEYQAAAADASLHTLLFGDRFPFRYLVDDYGLSYYAAFVGCSAESEASFETVTFLAQKVDELSLPAVMTIEGTDHRIAETIVRNTRTKDQQILTMDSMQSTTAGDAANGKTYLSVMEKNLSVLKEALKQEADAVSDTGIDVDLTVLSSTMVYAEVYNIMVAPEEYMGKTIKMEGLFSYYYDEETGQEYFSCIIQDATACCAQGIEFVLAGEYSYPEDYPEEDAEICVVGVFDTYREGDATYCTLRNAKML